MKLYNYLTIIFLLSIILVSSISGSSISNLSFFSVDKLLHIIEYFLLGLFLFNSLFKKTRFPALLCLILGTFFAIVDELYQSTVIGRIPSSFDVIADFVGLTLSILSNKIFTKKLN